MFPLLRMIKVFLVTTTFTLLSLKSPTFTSTYNQTINKDAKLFFLNYNNNVPMPNSGILFGWRGGRAKEILLESGESVTN